MVRFDRNGPIGTALQTPSKNPYELGRPHPLSPEAMAGRVNAVAPGV